MSQLVFQDTVDPVIVQVDRILARFSDERLAKAQLFKKSTGDGSYRVYLRYETKWLGLKRTQDLYLGNKLMSAGIYERTRKAIEAKKMAVKSRGEG